MPTRSSACRRATWARYKSYQPEDPAGLFMVKPISALAWTVFPGNVTRFTFQSP